MDSTWNPTENLATKFEHDDKIKQQLKKVGIPADPYHHLGLFKIAMKFTGTFYSICKWKAKPTGDQNSLLCVGTCADSGYVTIFHDGNKGATIHDRNNVTITCKHLAILQGW